jgi:hypothetical protein
MTKKTSKKNRELPVSEEAFGKITALTDIYNSRLTIEQEEISIELNVEVARSRGATWQELGEVLGISRSAAQKRFGSYLDEAMRPLPADARPANQRGRAGHGACQAVDCPAVKGRRARD